MRKIIQKLLLILIGINVIYVISGVINTPLGHIDVYSIWLLKAKVFYLYGGFPLEFLRTIGYSHPQYPVLLPFIFSLIYKIVGGVSEFYVLFLSPLVYLGILVFAYKTFIKLNLSKTHSLFFVYLYSMFSPFLAQGGRGHAGMADIFITLIGWLIVYLMLKTTKEKKTNLLYVIVALVMVASQIKFEGIFMVWALLFLPIKPKEKIFWSVFSVIPVLLWTYLRQYLGIPADFGLGLVNISKFISDILIVGRVAMGEMLNVRNWYVFWIVFLPLFIIQKNKDKVIKKSIEPAVVLMAASFVATYVFIQLDTAAQASSSIDRIMLQLSPFFFTVFVHRMSLVLGKISS